MSLKLLCFFSITALVLQACSAPVVEDDAQALGAAASSKCLARVRIRVRGSHVCSIENAGLGRAALLRLLRVNGYRPNADGQPGFIKDVEADVTLSQTFDCVDGNLSKDRASTSAQCDDLITKVRDQADMKCNEAWGAVDQFCQRLGGSADATQLKPCAELVYVVAPNHPEDEVCLNLLADGETVVMCG